MPDDVDAWAESVRATQEAIERRCPDCGGTGTVADHSPECYAAGECIGECPVAVPCENPCHRPLTPDTPEEAPL